MGQNAPSCCVHLDLTTRERERDFARIVVCVHVDLTTRERKRERGVLFLLVRRGEMGALSVEFG